MLFNSFAFAAFLPIVFTAYWSLGRARWRIQNAFLLAASYVFYGWWDWRFLSLVVLSSAVDFAVGRGLAKAEAPRVRRALLWVSLSVNLGMLGFFKYFGFFVDSAIALLESVGLEPGRTTLAIVLPMGISFYTFQTLSYTVDVYRGKLQPTRDPIAFFAFVSFFPQIVAGPIERAHSLLPQFRRPRVFCPTRAADGLRQMLWGLAKKVVVADNLAPVVDHAFAHHAQLDSVTLTLAAALFTVQLYCDFSGYSSMAIGIARLFGFELSRNFAYPFFARSMAELWRRWHISLSSWFRDYVYVPLGGSRHGLSRALRNVILVFVVSGLWHGADWSFAVWGLLNGLFLVPSMLSGHRVPRDVVAAGRLLPTLREAASMARTFWLYTFSLVFFRATGIGDAGAYLTRLATAGVAGFDPAPLTEPLLLAGLMLAIEWLHRDAPHGLSLGRLPLLARWAAYCGVALTIMVVGSIDERAFVYFQF